MSTRAGTQLGDVNRLGEIHLEERALAECQGKQVIGSVRIGRGLSHLRRGLSGAVHDVVVALLDAGAANLVGHVVAVQGGEVLADLDAAAVAVQVAIGADIHQDVEAELLPGGESAQKLVVLATVAQAEVDDFVAPRLAQTFHRLANLPVGMMAMLVEQRGGEFDLEGLVFEQHDGGGRVDGQIAHQLGGGLREFAACFHFVAAGVGVLEQRRRNAHRLEQHLARGFGKLAVLDAVDKPLKRRMTHVERRFPSGLLEQLTQPLHFRMGVREQT